jgi:hypothetical protein
MNNVTIRNLADALTQDGEHFDLSTEVDHVLVDMRCKTKVSLEDVRSKKSTDRWRTDALLFSPKLLKGAKELSDSLVDRFTDLGYFVKRVEGGFTFYLTYPDKLDGEGSIRLNEKLATAKRRFTQKEILSFNHKRDAVAKGIMTKRDAYMKMCEETIEKLNALDPKGKTLSEFYYGDMDVEYKDRNGYHDFFGHGYSKNIFRGYDSPFKEEGEIMEEFAEETQITRMK